MNVSPHVPQAILDAAAAGPDALGDAIRAAGGAPLQSGRTTTFLFVGEAEGVALQHWMDIFPALPPFARQPGTDLWTLTVELPEGSRIEYKLSVKGPGRRRLLLDPLNPRRARDPFGANSVVTGPLYERPDWSLPHLGIPAGNVEYFPVESEVFGDRRRAGLYLPANSGSDPLPLIVAHDGSEYVEFAALAVVLDNLIAAGELPPVACVLTDPHDRTHEYAGDDRHADHIVHELIPAVEARVRIAPENRVALGASLGAVAALHAAWRHPGVFAGLVLQSGSFVTRLGGPHRRGPVFAPVVEFMARFTAEPGELPPRISMSCGRFDGLIADNRAFAQRLRDLGVGVVSEAVPDGHNWENWRDRLRAGLFYAVTGNVRSAPQEIP